MGKISLALLPALAAMPSATLAARPTVESRFLDPAMPVLVVAHRACHTPAPHAGMTTSNPENSLAGIERCIDLGVDVGEVDVRRTKDGYLVLMHDPTVDRTTNGHGAVATLSLAEIKRLRLRENEGGPNAPLTDQQVPTLAEALETARGKILLNLDVQEGLYADTVAEVLRVKQQDEVIVKEPAGVGSPVLADIAPFNAVPFMAIPMSASDGSDLPSIVENQLRGSRKPVAFELPRMPQAPLSLMSEIARKAGIRLWNNTLWEGFIQGYGGDADAMRDPELVWGKMRHSGISVFQTDEPEALLRYLRRDKSDMPSGKLSSQAASGS